MFCLLLFMSLTLTLIGSRSMFYETNELQLDCLHYHLSNTDIVQFCLRPIDDNNGGVSVDFINTRDRNFTFEQLRQSGVTTQELLSWSTSIDLAQRYQYYIDQQQTDSLISHELFFNCTSAWFGQRCQYSFELNEKTFKIRSTDDTIPSVADFTCYILLECVRDNGSFMCLDWREVCDGRIDCLNGGVDEASCFDLETNECNENEYRCHNGLCIPKYFWVHEQDTAECLDQSDLPKMIDCTDSYLESDLFECEENSCRPVLKKFSCGDGECVEDFDECNNGRHLLLIESMSVQGNLSHDCWTAMMCLTKMTSQIEGISCEQFELSDIIIYLHRCEFLTQFPTVPVLYGHVRFFYRPNEIVKVNRELALVPHYVCYDELLCDFLTPTFRNGNFTCRHGHEMGLKPNATHRSWKSIIDSVKPYFRGCVTVHGNDSLLLYACKNSSKLISKHRIVDDISDCYLNDDEQEFELSCSLNDSHRFKCSNETQCRSPLISRNICSPTKQRHFDEILFHEICDRAVDVVPVIINGRNHTDETDCEHWQCSNVYTQCDGVWNCPNGDDEQNCSRPVCDPHLFACVIPFNYTLTCLPADRVGDGNIDCLGASDEHQLCRSVTFNTKISYEFHCLNHSRCLKASDLCNGHSDCPRRDDETFCTHQSKTCDEKELDERDDVVYVLCRIGAKQRKTFSLATSSIYPPSSGNTRKTNNRVTDWPVKGFSIRSQFDDVTSLARCHRGIAVRLWLGSNNYSSACFCPPNYYGDTCQYQSQRVSLTLSLTIVNRHGIYVLVAMLIDDDDDEQQQIHSYDQSIYVPKFICGKPINIYLLYSTRPKNSSKNYSIRIDAFDKTSLTYLASWHLPIPFVFLPVHRLSAVLTLPAYRLSNPSYCSRACHKGTCVKYANKNKHFCLCDPGWSGAWCHIPVDCSHCSPDSICIGSIRNRSICVCPVNKFGTRCLISLSCPRNLCNNNGRCVVIDMRMIDDSFVCFCPKQFHGPRCANVAAQLELSFDNMKVPSYLLAFMYSVLGSELPTAPLVIVRKLTMFQRTVTLYSPYIFRIVFVKIDDLYYLTALQPFGSSNLSTSIGPTQQCVPIDQLFTSEQLALPRIQRVKFSHVLCRTFLDLQCFIDEFNMCLCTIERHANCFRFDHDRNFSCQHNIHCQNGGQCLIDDSACPLNTICICVDCFFGDRCQFYGKGIGLTLDDMLYQVIRPNIEFHNQSILVKISAALTMIIFVAGLLNSILSILVFQNRDLRKIGCGMYLYASSITSALTVSMLTIKFWFVAFTQINGSIHRSVLRGGCILLEPVLKLFFYMGNWLNACVAIERALATFLGANFDKTMSKRIAGWMIAFLPLTIMGTIIHESFYRDLFDNYDEQRVWCVTRYSRSIHNLNTTMLFIHFLAPFCANLFSSLFIIFTMARRRAMIQTRQSYKQHLRQQINEHAHLVISSMVLVGLSLPRFLISLFVECVTMSRNSWLYLFGYFVSFISSAFVFIIFVLPSALYKRQFKDLVKRWQR